MCWNTRTFSATAGNCLTLVYEPNYHCSLFPIGIVYSHILGGGAFCNGQKIHSSKTDLVSS